MKTTLIGLILLGFTMGAMAIDKMELDNRILTLTTRFAEMQQKPDKAIPADTLRRAQGIILLDRTKAGFVFAYQGGGGVAMVRNPSGRWSPVGFVNANEGSLGFQAGGEESFFVILLMNTNATRVLTEPHFDFGAEARGTAGDQSGGAQGLANSPPLDILVYDDHKGFYGGVSIKAGGIMPDDQANDIYYDQPVTMWDILFGDKVQRTPNADALDHRIHDAAASPQSIDTR
jgi:SH3 domain-containing YSC84-like protein 1